MSAYRLNNALEVMSKIFFKVSLFTLVLFSNINFASGQTRIVIPKQDVNVRMKPDHNAEIIFVASANDTFNVGRNRGNSWTEIVTNEGTGYN